MYIHSIELIILTMWQDIALPAKDNLTLFTPNIVQ